MVQALEAPERPSCCIEGADSWTLPTPRTGSLGLQSKSPSQAKPPHVRTHSHLRAGGLQVLKNILEAEEGESNLQI